MITSEEIKRKLWAAANELRGSMDASRYKDYMLGLMFYKFLSDKTLDTYRRLSKVGNLSEKELIKSYKENAEDLGQQLFNLIDTAQGYYVEPHNLYQVWLQDIDKGSFEVQKVIDSLNDFERNISTEDNDFKGLFSSSTLDLSNTALGSNLTERSKNIKELILLFSDLNMVKLQEGDVLGDAYEYLIGMFAMESGKKAGEFYTPRQVSEVMARIVAKSGEIRDIYDPTVGSASLLLTVKKHLRKEDQKFLKYYGQEKNTATYNLTRMNLLLHGVRPENMIVKNGDSLAEDWPEDESNSNKGIQFDAVVMNPPYSLSNWNKAELKISDPRFESVGTLPPNSKGDYAFLLHGLYHLASTGTMAIVLPHGVLFRGSSEGDIRQKLLESSKIDTIIGLPANLFTNTGIPVCILILKKDRKINDPVLFIDASKSFVKQGKQNALQEKDIAKIVDTYEQRTSIKGYSKLVSREEIIENEYNLNIPRYIESIDEEIPHDVDAHLFGGIPLKNIEDLKILNSVAKDTITDHFSEIRPGYLELKTSIEDLTKSILEHDSVVEMTNALREKAKSYIDSYWKDLHEIDSVESVLPLRDKMLMEIKEILADANYIDEYNGYQIIAEIWDENVRRDAEVIAQAEFYEVAKAKIPNMVTKGSGRNKREEQDGWIGQLVPNELIEKHLFVEENDEIEEIKNRILENESELSDLIELAKEEDTEENLALYEVLKKDAEGEPKDSFDASALKKELSSANKDSDDYKLLKKVDTLSKEKTKLAKELKEKESSLKEAVYDKIDKLTDEEADMLIYEKWFGDSIEKIVSLVHQPLLAEINIIKELNERYSETIDDIDKEIAKVQAEFEELASQLVVTQ